MHIYMGIGYGVSIIAVFMRLGLYNYNNDLLLNRR